MRFVRMVVLFVRMVFCTHGFLYASFRFLYASLFVLYAWFQIIVRIPKDTLTSTRVTIATNGRFTGSYLTHLLYYIHTRKYVYNTKPSIWYAVLHLCLELNLAQLRAFRCNGYTHTSSAKI
jgi:hypothetical protein